MVVDLIDGTYHLFRQVTGLRVGRPQSVPMHEVVIATIKSVLDLIDLGATHIGVATDHTLRSFRHDLWRPYKCGRHGGRSALTAIQFLEDGLEAMGIRVWRMESLEADDGLASAAAFCAGNPEVDQVRIWSADKDLAQCVRAARVVQGDLQRQRTRDAQGVKSQFGVEPELIPDYLALVGDQVDALPGVPGMDHDAAVSLLNRHGPLEIFPPAVLGEARERALFFKRLATLVTDAPVMTAIDELRWHGPTPAFARFAAELKSNRRRMS